MFKIKQAKTFFAILLFVFWLWLLFIHSHSPSQIKAYWLAPALFINLLTIASAIVIGLIINFVHDSCLVIARRIYTLFGVTTILLYSFVPQTDYYVAVAVAGDKTTFQEFIWKSPLEVPIYVPKEYSFSTKWEFLTEEDRMATIRYSVHTKVRNAEAAYREVAKDPLRQHLQNELRSLLEKDMGRIIKYGNYNDVVSILVAALGEGYPELLIVDFQFEVSIDESRRVYRL